MAAAVAAMDRTVWLPASNRQSLPLSLGFNATQGLVDSAEVSTQVGASVGWRVSPRVVGCNANLSTTNDDLFNVSERGLSMAWNLNKLWQGKLHHAPGIGARGVRLQPAKRDSTNLNGRVPQQRRTRLGPAPGVE
jgi:hypothetical protein